MPGKRSGDHTVEVELAVLRSYLGNSSVFCNIIIPDRPRTILGLFRVCSAGAIIKVHKVVLSGLPRTTSGGFHHPKSLTLSWLLKLIICFLMASQIIPSTPISSLTNRTSSTVSLHNLPCFCTSWLSGLESVTFLPST